MRQSLVSAPLASKPYRLAELFRTRWFERGAIRRAAAVLTLSEADFAVVSRLNRNVVLARPGVELGSRQWARGPAGSPPRLVFAGAMWRRANVLIAHFLVRDVMPLVWRDFPTAQLRIVGARPPTDVIELASADGRVVVTGEVPDIRDEMLDSHAVLAPSIVGGGVLMKVAHAMALGCPVVTSPGPAASVDGDETSLFIGSGSESLADALRRVLGSPDEAARRGHNAREHIGRLFRWDDTVDAYLSAYAMARRA
jgi:glycosyltransferase involved in cell wall biosynthesis